MELVVPTCALSWGAGSWAVNTERICEGRKQNPWEGLPGESSYFCLPRLRRLLRGDITFGLPKEGEEEGSCKVQGKRRALS